MNTKAECPNPKCSNYGVEKSVAVGQMWGYGAPNDRVTCAVCGTLMKTTQTVNTSSKGRGKTLGRGLERKAIRSKTSTRAGGRKRIRKRIPKR
jgi:hypothetical protein